MKRGVPKDDDISKDEDAPLATRQRLIPESPIILFFKEMAKEIDKQDGEFTKESFLNAAMLACPPDARDEMIHFIKAQPSSFLKQLKKKEEPRSSVQQAMVAAPVYYAARKKALPFLLDMGVPVLVSFIPGGCLVKDVAVPVVEFSAEFLGEVAKGYIQKLEKTPTEALYSILDKSWKVSSNAATSTMGRLSSLVRRTPAALPATVPTAAAPSIPSTRPSAPAQSDLYLAMQSEDKVIIFSGIRSISPPSVPSSTVTVEEVIEDKRKTALGKA